MSVIRIQGRRLNPSCCGLDAASLGIWPETVGMNVTRKIRLRYVEIVNSRGTFHGIVMPRLIRVLHLLSRR